MKETEEDQDAQEINAILSNKGLTIAEKTRKLRDIRGLTQQVLAARSDMGTRTLQNIENGTTLKPQQHTLEGLAKGLGLDAEHAKRLARTARKRSSEPQAVPTEPQGNSGNIVYIIVPSLENVFWPDVLKGFVTELSPSYNPYHTPPAVMTAATAAPICHGERWESFAAAIEHVTRWRHQAAGCLVVPPRAMPVGVDSDAMVGAIVDKLRDLHHQRVPVVVVDRPLASPPFIWPSNLSAIQGDDETLLSSYEVVRTRLLSATEPERAGELVTRTEWPAELAKVGIHDRAAGYVIGQALVQAYRDAGVNLLPRLHCVLEDKSASVEVMRVEGMEHALQEMAQTLHSSGHLSSPQLPATYVRRYSFEEVMKVCLLG